MLLQTSELLKKMGKAGLIYKYSQLSISRTLMGPGKKVRDIEYTGGGDIFNNSQYYYIASQLKFDF